METNKLIYLDGAMGTQLQANGLAPGESPEVFMMTHEQIIVDIHKSYMEHGSEIIYANTFGANRKKLEHSGYEVKDIIHKAISLAKQAVGDQARVALDIGPIGELLEPNGYLSFEEAYDIYREQIVAGEEAGADLVVFETMSDLMEIKAAILAAKEHSSLPIFVTMSFESDGRTFTGCSVESFAITAQRLGVDAVGINCSLGPQEIFPIAKRLANVVNLPLIIKANAGLPDPISNQYGLDAQSFAKEMKQYEELPIRYIGGCCGTTPDFIEALKAQVCIGTVSSSNNDTGYVCSPICCKALNDIHVIGERINPTGNKRMKEALLSNNLDGILAIAMEEVEAGADILDVNVGLPGIQEKEMMVRVIQELQTVIDVPLQIDSTDPEVIEAALRIYNGIPIVNSCNGEQKSMETILPLIKKYGANVIGLTLDEHGIPETCEQRLLIGKRIVDKAASYGIEKQRVLLDCLTLTVSAQQSGAMETLKTLRAIRDELGVQTVLGVSNISFGLPQRSILNQHFLTMALSAGLTMPIINPNQKVMMDAIRSYRVLAGYDVDCMDYVEAYADMPKQQTPTVNQDITLIDAICKGLKEETRQLTKVALETMDALTIVNEQLIPALDIVGNRYEKKEIYLPGLINAATASQGAFEEIRNAMRGSGEASISKGKIILATVKGDVHDIGKNIVKVVLENYGFTVIDLGKDVAVETVVETAIKEDVYLIGLSALMTTTLASMEATIQALHDSGHPCKVMVGGAVVSPDYAASIHADYYAKDAKQSADIAKEVFQC